MGRRRIGQDKKEGKSKTLIDADSLLFKTRRFDLWLYAFKDCIQLDSCLSYIIQHNDNNMKNTPQRKLSTYSLVQSPLLYKVEQSIIH